MGYLEDLKKQMIPYKRTAAMQEEKKMCLDRQVSDGWLRLSFGIIINVHAVEDKTEMIVQCNVEILEVLHRLSLLSFVGDGWVDQCENYCHTRC